MSKQIVKIEELGERDLIDITTSTRTFVANNLVTHNCFTVMFDEMAHMITGTEGPRTADEVYNAITPALDQFGNDGMIYIPSSPYTKIGRAYQLYEDSLSLTPTGQPANPNMLLIQLASWDPYVDWDDPKATGGFEFKRAPQMYDEQMQTLERREPTTFRVERMSQWAEVVDAFLNPAVVDRIYDPFVDAEGVLRTISETPAGQMRYLYRGHCDPSHTDNNTACIIAHPEKIRDPETGEEWFHIITDWIKVWKPEDYPDHQLDWPSIEKEICEKMMMFPTLRVFSYDQFGSFVTVPSLKRELREAHHKAIVKEVTFTGPSKQRMAERLKASLGMGWVHCYKDSYGNSGSPLLADELKFWQTVNGRLKKQTVGPITTDDIADCLLCVVDELLEDNFVRLETRERLGSTKLLFEGQGGYSSQNLSNENMSASRRKLSSFSRTQQTMRPLYNGMGERATSPGKPGRRG